MNIYDIFPKIKNECLLNKSRYMLVLIVNDNSIHIHYSNKKSQFIYRFAYVNVKKMYIAYRKSGKILECNIRILNNYITLK